MKFRTKKVLVQVLKESLNDGDFDYMIARRIDEEVRETVIAAVRKRISQLKVSVFADAAKECDDLIKTKITKAIIDRRRTEINKRIDEFLSQ